MKKILFILSAVFLFSACALEIANVIGPSGGWVFYDKGNYDDQWRYIECANSNLSEIDNTNLTDAELLKKAMDLCSENTAGWYTHSWELPTADQMRKMLECFSYGLTQFKSNIFYLSVQKPDKDDVSTWEPVIYHMDYSRSRMGKPVIAPDYKGVIKIRPIRKF